MTSVRWDEKANIKFISLYEQNSCLWKTDSPSYKNREMRERAINSVVEAMGMPDFRNLDCKNKIKNVRSHYIQELKKIKRSRRHSRTGEPTYEPKLAWFAPLNRFLRPHILTLTKVGGVNQRNSSNTRGGGALGGDAEDSTAQDTSTAWQDESQDGIGEVDTVVEGTSQATATNSDNNNPTPRYAFIDADDDEGSSLEDRKPRKRRALACAGGVGPETPAPSISQVPGLILEEQMVSVTQDQKDTEFEAFGRSIAAQMKNMPFHVALQLQLKIQTLITEERLRIMRSPTD